MVLDVEVNPDMPRMKSKAGPECYGPVSPDDYEVSRLTREELFRIVEQEMDKTFDRGTSHFNYEIFEDTEEKSKTNQRLASDLQHDARQPRLATESDEETDTKTSKRTEGAAAENGKNGDISSATVDDGPTSLTRFGMIAEPLLMAPEKCICDALVNEGAEAPKPHLSPVEVCMLSSTPVAYCPPAHTLQRGEPVFYQRLFLEAFGWSR